MYKVGTLTICVLLLLSVAQARQARGQFSIHAASDQAVPGWNRTQFQDKTIWVNPMISLSPSEILRALQTAEPNGRLSVDITFTDAGAQKMRNLSAAQKDKLIAMVLDGMVIFAPRVRGEMGKEAQITGDQPTGLSAAIVDRLLGAINDLPDDLPVQRRLK